MRSDRGYLKNVEEIELRKVVGEFWRRRVFLVSITLFFLVLSIVYILIAKPVYEVKTFVRPPTQNDITVLNYGRGGESGLSLLASKDIYNVYLRALQSESLRRVFFNDVYLPAITEGQSSSYSRDEQYAKFLKVIEVTQASKSFQDIYSISVKAGDPSVAVDWAGRYAGMAADLAKKDILNDVRSDALAIARNIEQQIAIAQESAQKSREDRIAQLKEALEIAKSIGLEQPPLVSKGLVAELSADMTGSLTYMRGSRAILSEIDNLEKRTSNDPYIKNLRKKQADLEFYRGLSFKAEDIQVFRPDGGIELPDQPIKPNKPLVLVFGLLGGLLLGGGLVCALMIWREAFATETDQASRLRSIE